MDDQDKTSYSYSRVTSVAPDRAMQKIPEESSTPTTPTSWERVTPTPRTPPREVSATPSVASTIWTQAASEEKIGDVKGIELIFGTIPSCHCGMEARLHLSLKEGKNFERTFLRYPRPIGRHESILRVDELSTLPGRDELQVQESRAEGPDLCGGTTSDRTRTLCSPHHDKGWKQRLCREGDACDLQEGTAIREEDQCSGLQGRKEPQGQHGGGLRGVPEVSRVAASAEGLDEGFQEVPPKTI